MLLKEMFDNILPWEWDDAQTSGTHMEASFVVGDLLYGIEFQVDSIGAWDIQFGSSERGGQAAPKNNITGTGQSMAVFATVVDIVKNFIDEVDPDEMSFTAKKSEPSRVALYNRMLKMFPKDKWYTEVTEMTVSVHYTIMTKAKWEHTSGEWERAIG